MSPAAGAFEIESELDLYDPRNPNQPPYRAEFIARFRAAQLARMRRRTVYVRELPPSHVSRVFEASPAAIKDYLIIKGANHYYADQPHHLDDVVRQSLGWLRRNGLAG